MKENKLLIPRFPHLNNIVDKVFGAGNLESWEYEEAKQLVLLAKEELLKDLELKEVDLKQLYREYINNTYSEEFAQSILDGNIKGDLDNSDLFGIMSYGFELGLKTQKEET